MVIHKYLLEWEGTQAITLPISPDPKILHIGLQKGLPHIWVAVDPNGQLGKIHIKIAGTGHREPPFPYVHFNTIITKDDFVWHFYCHERNK